MKKTLKRVAVAVAAMLLAAIGIVSCDDTACAATTGFGVPRPAPAPAPRAPSFSKPSAPRPYTPRPSTPRPPSSGHSTTVVPVPVYVDDDDHC